MDCAIHVLFQAKINARVTAAVEQVIALILCIVHAEVVSNVLG